MLVERTNALNAESGGTYYHYVLKIIMINALLSQYELEGWIPGRSEIFYSSLLHSDRLKTHPVSCPSGTRSSLPGSNAAGA